MTMCAFADVHIKREGLGDPAQGLEATGKASHKGSGCSSAFRSLEQEEWAASPVVGGGLSLSLAPQPFLSSFVKGQVLEHLLARGFPGLLCSGVELLSGKLIRSCHWSTAQLFNNGFSVPWLFESQLLFLSVQTTKKSLPFLWVGVFH